MTRSRYSTMSSDSHCCPRRDGPAFSVGVADEQSDRATVPILRDVMPSRFERTRVEQPATANDSGDGSGKTVIRVKRGALRRFDQLKTKSEGLPVEVKWDRRTSDRRSEPSGDQAERRKQERRQAPPFTWDAAEFVIVGDHARKPDTGSEPEGQNRVAESRGRRRR